MHGERAIKRTELEQEIFFEPLCLGKQVLGSQGTRKAINICVEDQLGSVQIQY